MNRLIVIFSAVLVQGCTTLSAPKSSVDLGAGGFGASLEAPADINSRWRTEAVNATPAAIRRELALSLIGLSDLRCDRYLVSISQDRNTTRGSLDILGLMLAAIGGVASPNTAANWFSAGSTLAQSSRRSLEETVFGGREFGLVYTAIWKGRDEARSALVADITNGTYDTWGQESILSLVRQYDVKCGINYGLSQLSVAVSSVSPPVSSEQKATKP